MRPEAPHYPHHVLEDRVGQPEAHRLVQRARVTEVVGAGEELPGAVQLPRRDELLRAQQPQRHPELSSDQVLPTLAPREREVGGLGSVPAGHQGQKAGVLVVGVRADHEHAVGYGQAVQKTIQLHQPAGGRRLQLGGQRLAT